MVNVTSISSKSLLLSTLHEHFFLLGPLNVEYRLLVLLATQFLGLTLAGFTRSALVWPVALVWPQALVTTTLLKTLHQRSGPILRGTISWWFQLVFIAATLYYFIPGYLFQALSIFTFICWAGPTTPVINQLFGMQTGLGMSVLSFDWARVSALASPLVVPLWAQLNLLAGFLFMFWIIAPAVYYTNAFNTSYFPIWSTGLFDRFGTPYRIPNIVSQLEPTLNLTAYEAYSSIQITAVHTLSIAFSLLLMVALVVHTVLNQGPSTWMAFTAKEFHYDDIHMKLVKSYRDLPKSTYWMTSVVGIGCYFGVISCKEFQLPVWSGVVALVISVVYFLPCAFVAAQSALLIDPTLLAQMLAGTMFAGNGLSNAAFTALAVDPIIFGVQFSQNLKVAHYIKLNVQSTFIAQAGTIVVISIAQALVDYWITTSVPNLCFANQIDGFTCPKVQNLYSDSVLWGLVGPSRVFGSELPYRFLLFIMIAGAGLPLITWVLARVLSYSWIRYIHVPIIFTSALYVSSLKSLNITSFLFVGFVAYFVKKKWNNHKHTLQYTYTISAALTAGTTLGMLIIFLCLHLPNHGINLNWWGNQVFVDTLDWRGVSHRQAPQGGL